MSAWPTKILVGTDGSEEAALAARIAVALAQKTGSELHIVHVGEFLSTFFAQTEVEPAQVEREARDLLDEQVKRIEGAGGTVTEAHLRLGRADTEIVNLAEQVGAGLVVMGSRGLGGIRRALMGSVSDSVVRHAHCPVLVVRGREGGEPVLFSGRILVATDGSEEAGLALKTAVDLANSTNSELHVVHVGHLLGYVGYVAPGLGAPVTSAQEELDRKARELLEAQLEQIQAAGSAVTQAHLGSGRPDEEIVALGERIGAGLIVIGSRGLGGIRRALIGSVSDSVVRHAHCPVLIGREEKQ